MTIKDLRELIRLYYDDAEVVLLSYDKFKIPHAKRLTREMFVTDAASIDRYALRRLAKDTDTKEGIPLAVIQL